MHTPTDIKTDPLAVVHELYAAWEANDADALVALYTEDATVVRPGSFNRARGSAHVDGRGLRRTHEGFTPD